MATNEILEFAEDATGGDILSQAAYAADTDRLDGHQVGIARQELENKVLRQVSLVSSALAKFIADSQSNNVVDSIDAATLAGYLTTALRGFNVPTVAAGGTADVMTAAFSPAVSLTNGLIVVVRAVGANTVVAPTLNANGAGGVAIVKDNNAALRIGDISGAAHWMVLVYSSTLTKYILVNPAFNPATQSEVNAGAIDTAPVTPLRLFGGGAASLGTSGYIKFPSWLFGGFVMQWGGGTITTGNTTLLINFPLAFPTAAFAGFVTRNATNSSVGDMYAVEILSTTQMNVHRESTAGSNRTFFYLVIGH